MRTRRARGGSLVLVASLSALVLVVAVVAALALLRPTPSSQSGQPDSTTPTVTPDPTPTPPPAPTGLRIVEDAGGAATLTWIDPSDGEVPFVISAGRRGDALIAISTVPAGETTTTIYGLNVNYDYCFTVAAVWSSEHLSESDRTCTRRTAVTPPPA
ncbi:MAG: fibronectin type III [Dactylosporangium sp.]|nr:fibronectin type III [Dactylosporangium sp.]